MIWPGRFVTAAILVTEMEEDDTRPADSIQIPEDPALQVEIFVDRLDDEIRSRQFLKCLAGGDPSLHRRLVGRAEGSLVDAPLKVLVDGGQSPLEKLFGAVDQKDRMPGCSGHLCDAIAHGAATHDSHGPDFHGCLPISLGIR